ncbi:helix-turn-helix domain-containing protein [Bacillus vallismortis]|uniref:helix-turn-helix domain-containing protein n=1 Tax=Bacillus vallismortis TaxID=72361 RepID=UPI003DB13728
MLGKRIAALRKEKGLSQYELADRLGFSRGKLANYEQGTREPDYETLIKIADFFDVSTDYLLRGKDKSSNIITDDAKIVLNDPETFLAAKDGEVTDEILQAALEIITEQLKERRKSDK